MKKIYLFIVASLLMMASACTDDLDQQPHVGASSGTVYSSIEGYQAVLAKIYGSYSLVGQGRAGDLDIGGNKDYDLMRKLFNLQEAGTEETAMTWLSGSNMYGIVYITFDATDPWVSDTYYRLYYSVALCNEFLRYCDEGTIGGFPQDQQAEIRSYAAEARFIRALDYFYVLDLFGQGPYVDENTPTSGVIPEAYTNKQLFAFINSEIAEISELLPETNSYARACKAAAWALGARLNLNGEVYTGESHATECIDYCKKIISSGRYSLEPEYAKLFNADNHLRTNEIIFAFACDADKATTWGSGTYFVAGECGSDSSQNPADYGLEAGWGNFRVRGELPALFENGDSRYMFWSDGQTQYFTNAIDTHTEGYYSEKWSNLTDDGVAASKSAAYGCNTDVPMFRLADVYLMAAEAVLRGGNGYSRADALGFVNLVRERAYGSTAGDISDAQLTLNFMLDERGREMYLEWCRRSDLVRFDCFTTDKRLWQWKGGVLDGTAVNSRYNVYPIPATELSANPNLKNANY